jgi:hypothetical protein
MEIENGAFAKKEVFWVSGSGFPAKADIVVKIDDVEPRLDVSASLGVLPNVLTPTGKDPCLRIFPGDDFIRILPIFFKTPIEFVQLLLSDGDFVGIGR